ncbi:MAG TPA: Holliday junction branch migration DNA helicase RuvB, partial [Coriobacteriia bacterium]|nr:Holliday junction branch migration DNA helicase RuvB [Coriobacteriia bacterium]
MWENDTYAPDEGERLVSAEFTEDDLEIDRSLRPRRLDEYLGQTRVKENLGVLIATVPGIGKK